jgi:hypothetical protein
LSADVGTRQYSTRRRPTKRAQGAIAGCSASAACSVCILLEMLLYGMKDIALHSQMMYNSGRKTKSNVMM